MKKPKQTLALFLALLALLALLAGCEKEIVYGPDEDPALTPDAYAEILEGVGASDYDGMDDAQRRAMEDALRRKGFLPEDVTLPPAGETVPIVKATTMPAGVQVKPSEVYPHVKAVQDIFNSGTFYLKGRGASPLGIGSGGYAPMVIAVNKDKVMAETEVDWLAMMKAGAQQGDAGMSTVQGAIFQTTFGRKFRMVFSPEGAFWAFPDNKKYINLADLAQAGASAEEQLDTSEVNNLAKEISGMFGGHETPKDIPSSKVKVDGKEYLCGTFMGPDGKPAMRYFFLDGKFKRVEIFAQYEEDNVVYEIDEFTGKVDEKLFGLSGYRAIPLAELLKLGGGVAELFTP